MEIRPTHTDDVAGLQRVLDQTELFPSDLLPDMIADHLSDTESGDIWLTCLVDRKPVGFCYAMPEHMTDGAWNMLALAVLPNQQGHGVGRALVRHLEAELRKRGSRIVIVDTSGTDAFAPTRAFYRQAGYSEEARIRGFWAAGDDKIVFWKAL